MISRSLLVFLSFIIPCLFSLKAEANIQVNAQGSTHREALNNALRQAVEMQLGTEIESRSLVENFQVVRQQILSHTHGFVSSYKILKEQTDSSGLVKLTIDATINEKSLHNSSTALLTLMKMAAHPQVYVGAIDEDFDAVSSLNDDFHLLTQSIEETLREDFKFAVINTENARLKDHTPYRYSGRRQHLRRAQQSKADFLIIMELLKNTTTAPVLRLESLEVATGRSLGTEEITFPLENETNNPQQEQKRIIALAQDYLYPPTAQLAASLVEHLQQEVYGDGQRFELGFYRFDEKTAELLKTDLPQLKGFVRTKITGQKKNALNLSYWSLLEPRALHREISNLLKAHNIAYRFSLEGQRLSYRFNDPIFE